MKRIAAGVAAGVAARAAVRRARALDLRGRTVLITGGSRGLGFALAQELAREGARLAICARGEEALAAAREKLEAEGAEVLATRCDVGRRDEVDAWVAEAAARYGRIDVLCNVAGVISVGPFLAQRHEDFVEAIDIMFYGVLNPSLAVLPRLLEQGGGTIANVTSIGGKVAVPHLGSYTPAKFAAVGLSEGMHAELAPHGVRVVTIVPGLMRTGSHLAAFYKGDAKLEYGLFAPVASSPLNTVEAGRAARRIVKAIRLGETEVTIGLHAKLLAKVHGLAPGLVSEALGLVARALPESSAAVRARGDHVESPVDDSVVTALGRRAADEYNQEALDDYPRDEPA